MSAESIRKFREAVNASVSLQGEVRALGSGSPQEVVALAARHGYAFTVEELASFGESVRNELTDFELGLVAGGFWMQSQMAVQTPNIPPEKPRKKSSSSSYC